MDTSVCSSGGRPVKSSIDAASGKVAWAWGSVRPGISVAPLPSSTSAPSRGGVPPGRATAAIPLPSPSTSPRNGSPPLPSRTLTFVMRSTLTGPASPDAGAVLAFDPPWSRPPSRSPSATAPLFWGHGADASTVLGRPARPGRPGAGRPPADPRRPAPPRASRLVPLNARLHPREHPDGPDGARILIDGREVPPLALRRGPHAGAAAEAPVRPPLHGLGAPADARVGARRLLPRGAGAGARPGPRAPHAASPDHRRRRADAGLARRRRPQHPHAAPRPVLRGGERPRERRRPRRRSGDDLHPRDGPGPGRLRRLLPRRRALHGALVRRTGGHAGAPGGPARRRRAARRPPPAGPRPPPGGAEPRLVPARPRPGRLRRDGERLLHGLRAPRVGGAGVGGGGLHDGAAPAPDRGQRRPPVARRSGRPPPRHHRGRRGVSPGERPRAPGALPPDLPGGLRPVRGAGRRRQRLVAPRAARAGAHRRAAADLRRPRQYLPGAGSVRGAPPGRGGRRRARLRRDLRRRDAVRTDRPRAPRRAPPRPSPRRGPRRAVRAAQERLPRRAPPPDPG